MRYWILILLLGMGSCLMAHDVPIAHFNLMEKDTHLDLEMEFDLGALESAILAGKSKTPSSISDNQIKNYLGRHLGLMINGRKSVIEVRRISRKGHHVYITAFIKKRVHLIEKVVFENTCLIDTVPDHNNVLMTDINCLKRGFRLNKERQQVSFAY